MALKKPGGVKNFGAKNETFLTSGDKVKKDFLLAWPRQDEVKILFYQKSLFSFNLGKKTYFLLGKAKKERRLYF